MKKRTVIFLVALMVGCGIFSGCAKETSNEKSVSTQPQVESIGVNEVVSMAYGNYDVIGSSIYEI